MEKLTFMTGNVVVYVVIIAFIGLLVWWGWRLFSNKEKPAKNAIVLPVADEEVGEVNENQIEQAKKGKMVGTGNIRCLCFRKIKGVPVADFTTIPGSVGEIYSFDPSCPTSGPGYIVVETSDGDVVDYDPRQVKYTVTESPEYAWFATVWNIVNSVFFVPIQWWRSTSTWFAVGMLVILFIVSLVVFGG